jgi:methionine-rich copper-binding protein CopC
MPRRRALPLLAVTATPAAAQEPPRMLVAEPAARSVMNAQNQQFFLRFSGPVDHHASRLNVLQGGVVLRELQPRLGEQPNTLYASSGALPPDDDRLEWSAMPMRGGPAVRGALDFSVR